MNWQLQNRLLVNIDWTVGYLRITMFELDREEGGRWRTGGGVGFRTSLDR